MTRLAALASAATCIAAGYYLISIQAADPDSILESLCHGLGIYMIGKGIFVGALLWKQDAIERAVREPRREPPAGA